MNILVPINREDDIPAVCAAGAKELYIGFYDPAWEIEFGEYAHLNRMSGFGTDANRYTLEEMPRIVDLAHAHHALIYIVLNSAAYTWAQLSMVDRYLACIRRSGADGVIISCPEVAAAAHKAGIAPIASTMCGVYNRDIANFYVDLGVRRIILPRELSLREIEDLVTAVPNAEYEVFLMRSGCKFSDSHCLGYHRPEHPAPCRELKFARCAMCADFAPFQVRQDFNLNRVMFSQLFESGACGLCALYRLQQMGIAAGKIVGRAENPARICQDIALLVKNLEIASASSSELHYLEQMQMPENSDRLCFLGKSCYYPEVRFHR